MIRLTAERLREVLTYYPTSGLFRWKKRTSNRCKKGSFRGCNSRGYYLIQVDGKLYQAQVLAWLYMTGQFPQFEIDHRNGDSSNNRFKNLRDVPHAINQENRQRAAKHNASGFLGAHKNGNRFIARLTVRGNVKRLGTYATPEEAHNVYLKAKRQLHEGCTI